MSCGAISKSYVVQVPGNLNEFLKYFFLIHLLYSFSLSYAAVNIGCKKRQIRVKHFIFFADSFLCAQVCAVKQKKKVKIHYVNIQNRAREMKEE